MAKGVRLLSPPSRQQANQEIRPTSDRGREALFSILQPYLPKALVLDLFAGTGALGLEALSRGAAAAIFIDHNPVALKILQKNIMHCLQYFPPQAAIRTLRLTLPASMKHHLPEKMSREDFDGFHVVFADPPYGTGLAEKTARTVAMQQLLAADGVLVAEERRTAALPRNIDSLQLQDRRVYGEVAFHFYQENR